MADRRPPFQALVISELSRLGREQYATGVILRALRRAGVTLHAYLERREIKLRGAAEKAHVTLTTMADEMERERARQRTHDALRRKADRAHVETELAHFASAIAIGGDVPTLVAEMRARELRKAAIDRELRAASVATVAAGQDVRQLRALLAERLKDWRGLLERHTDTARQVLQQVLAGKITFTPTRGRWEHPRTTSRPRSRSSGCSPGSCVHMG